MCNCLTKAAMRRGGTAFGEVGGMRTADKERRRRTVVVETLTFVLVGMVRPLGSERWVVLELISMSWSREKGRRVR